MTTRPQDLQPRGGQRPPGQNPPRGGQRPPVQNPPRGPQAPPPQAASPQPVADPRAPDPRVTTYAEDLQDRDRDRDRWQSRRPRRFFDQRDLPWGQRAYGDYVFLNGYGWIPRWFPYWDERWYDVWQSLFDYYGGDQNADYAAYARDAAARSYARQYGWR